MTIKPIEIRKILSFNLKEQRKRTGISQEKLAEMTNLSVQTINDIEGCRKWVSDKTITKLASALNIECYQLLLPNTTIKKKSNVTQTQSLIELKRNIKKIVESTEPQIEATFNEFIKAGFN